METYEDVLNLLREEGYETRKVMVDGEMQEILSWEGLLRLCELVGGPNAESLKQFFIKKYLL